MLTVVFPTRNRAQPLFNALRSLREQTLPAEQFEVLIVDNGSTDDTRSIVQSFENAMNVRYFYDPVPGLHVGRHRGLLESRSDRLVFADDDIEATPSWLQTIDECFADPTVALVGGNNLPKFESEPPQWLQKLWRQSSFGGHAITSLSVLELPSGRRKISPYMVWGCNFAIRKQVLLDAGGFHPDGMPEEQIRFRGDGETHVSSHVAQHGLTCLFDSRASVYHSVPRARMSFEYFRKRAFNQGISDSYRSLRNAAAQMDQGGSALASVKRMMARAYKKLAEVTLDSELRELQHQIRAGYSSGYEYHQTAYRDDAGLRAWVHKANYFDGETK